MRLRMAVVVLLFLLTPGMGRAQKPNPPAQSLVVLTADCDPRPTTLCIPLDASFSVVPMDASGYCQRNDDYSSPAITLPFGFSLYGQTFTSCYINNNGNISFGSPYWTYTPAGFPVSGYPMVAAFWADVDTRAAASGAVWYRLDSNRLVVIWDHTGYYGAHSDKLNTFELILTDGTDPTIGVGNNVGFCYDAMQWTTGDASGGSDGFGGAPATVGINQGDGIHFAQLGRFDRPGEDYGGPESSTNGISYLDNKQFHFNAGVQNIAPVAGGFPENNHAFAKIGERFSLTTTFVAPELGQTVTTSVHLNGLDAEYVSSIGTLSQTTMFFTPAVGDIGDHVVTYVATDDGAPEMSTRVDLVLTVQRGEDTDHDGLLDAWESDGFDSDNDGHIDVDLPAMGADPDHPDIFVEADYMVGLLHTHRLRADAQQALIDAFMAHDIRLHIDAGRNSIMNPLTSATWGDLSRGDELDHENHLGETANDQYLWGRPAGASGGRYFNEIKRDHFEAARVPIFHYLVLGHDLGGTVAGRTGIARGGVAGGSDVIVTLADVSNITGSIDGGERLLVLKQTGTVMHELGHNLGLGHGGPDGINGKPNYLSVMNYSFQLPGLAIDGSNYHYDYSDFDLPALDEHALLEHNPLGDDPRLSRYGTTWRSPGGALTTTTNSLGEIDWNRNRMCDLAPYGQKVSDPSSAADLTVLRTWNDWAHLVFTGGSVGDAGARYDDAPDTMTVVLEPLIAGDPELQVAYPTVFARAGADTVVECCGDSVRLNGNLCQGLGLQYRWTAEGITFDDPAAPRPSALFPLGATEVVLAVQNGIEASLDTVVVLVRDTRSPQMSLEPSRSILWPPNHLMAMVHVHVVVSDQCDQHLTPKLVSVTSSELDGTGGDDLSGDVSGAEFGTADYDFEVRSERLGSGTGRIYRFCYEVVDASGNRAEQCRTVSVPHDQRGRAALEPVQGTLRLTLCGDGSNPVRGIDSRTVAVSTGDFVIWRAADRAAEYGDRDGDGAEDATFVLENASAPATGGGAPGLYARWEVAGHGFTADLPLASVAGVEQGSPTKLSAAVLPNPSRGGSWIHYSVPFKGNVQLAVYDLSGRLVAQLVDAVQEPGIYTARLEMGRAPASQVYLYRLTQNGSTVSGRFIVLK
jgi:hypothetical protein